MVLTGTKDVNEAYRQKKISMALSGMKIALLLPISAIIQNIFNSSVTESVNANLSDKIIISIIASITILAIGDIFAGIFVLIYNTAYGKGLTEYKRVFDFKISRTIILASLFAGPLATGCWMAATPFAGLTTVAIVTSLAPIFTVIVGRIFLKEHVSGRAVIGIAIVVAGAIIAGWEGSGGDGSNFILGIALAFVAPIGFTIEGQINTYAYDMVDPAVGVGMYRCFCSGIMGLILMAVLAAVTGNIESFGTIFSVIFTHPVLILLVALQGLMGAVNYLSANIAFNKTGPSRVLTIDSSRPLWSIPFGFLFAALGIAPYSVTKMGVVGAVIVVLGLVLVICKPSELVNLRGDE